MTIERVTAAEVHRAADNIAGTETALMQAVFTAEEYRLPHQIQRAVRAARGALPMVEATGTAALARLHRSLPAAS